MFYHVSTGDVILDITCELGYESYNKICGSGRLNGTFNISTAVEIERMFLFFFSPWNRYFNEISNMWQNGYVSKKQLKQILIYLLIYVYNHRQMEVVAYFDS